MAETLEAKTEHATFPGGLWEEDRWELRMNVEVRTRTTRENDKVTPSCPHCGPIQERVHVRAWDGGSTWSEFYCICPRVIVAINEGGYNSTGICADCVFEALKGLGHV